MDFTFTEEQRAFRDSVRTFAAQNLAAGAIVRAHSDDYPWDVARWMAGQGLRGITFRKQIDGFNVERIGNTARALALGRHAFTAARDHALVREQFGRPLAEFQGLQWKFADMKIKLDAAQLLLYRAACNADRGFPSAEETSIAKAYCNQVGFEVASEAMQVMGAAGYSESSLVEYCFRRTRGWMIAGGSIEMMRNRIAEAVFDRRFSQRPPRPK